MNVKVDGRLKAETSHMPMNRTRGIEIRRASRRSDAAILIDYSNKLMSF
jgi:hypothetical protein